MIFKTIAIVGKFAPLIRAKTEREAYHLMRMFERRMQNGDRETDSVECKLALAGGRRWYRNRENPVVWLEDYANRIDKAETARAIRAMQKGGIDHQRALYDPRTARAVSRRNVLASEYVGDFVVIDAPKPKGKAKTKQ